MNYPLSWAQQGHWPKLCLKHGQESQQQRKVNAAAKPLMSLAFCAFLFLFFGIIPFGSDPVVDPFIALVSTSLLLAILEVIWIVVDNKKQPKLRLSKTDGWLELLDPNPNTSAQISAMMNQSAAAIAAQGRPVVPGQPYLQQQPQSYAQPTSYPGGDSPGSAGQSILPGS